MMRLKIIVYGCDVREFLSADLGCQHQVLARSIPLWTIRLGSTSHTSSHAGVYHSWVIFHRCDGLRSEYPRQPWNAMLYIHTLRTAMGMVQFAAAPIRPTVLTNFSDTAAIPTDSAE